MVPAETQHNETHPWSLTNVMKHLLLHPNRVVFWFHKGHTTEGEVFRMATLFMVAASVLFSVTSVIHTPADWQLTQMQLVTRFFVMLGVTLVFFIPLLTLVWSVLQKFSSWFWDLQIPFSRIAGIAGLGIFYYALIMLVSIPVFMLQYVSVYLLEVLLFSLNIMGFVLSVRLFKHAYVVMADVSGKKALLIAFFPVIVVLVMYLLTQLLVYFTAMHAPAGH